MIESLNNYRAIEITLNVTAPVIVVPCNPVVKNSDVLVLDLGQLSLRTNNQEKKALAQVSEELVKLHEDDKIASHMGLYDTFQLELANIEMFMCQGGVDWRQSKSKSVILQPADLSLLVERCVIMDVFFSLPSMKFSGQLQEINVTISNLVYQQIMSLIQSFTGEMKSTAALEHKQGSESDQVYPALANRALKERKEENGDLVDEEAFLTERDLEKMLGSEKEAQTVLDEFDENKDGGMNGDEFNKWWSNRKKKLKNKQVMVGTFTIPKIAFTVSNDTKDKKIDVLTLTINGLDVSLLKRSYDLAVDTKLQSIQVENKMTQYKDSRYLISTGAQLSGQEELKYGNPKSSFFLLRYSQIDEKSPDYFETKIASVIQVEAETLKINLEPESVRDMGIFFLKDFLGDSKRAQDNSKDEIKTERKEAKDKKENDEENKIERAEFTKMLVNAKFGKLTLRLNWKDEPFSETNICGMRAEFNQYVKSQSIKLLLSEIEILDLTEAGHLHTQILQTTNEGINLENEKSLFAIFYDTFHPSEKEYPGYQQALQANLQGLRFTMLLRFINEIQAYALFGPIGELIDVIHPPQDQEDTEKAAKESKNEGIIQKKKKEKAKGDPSSNYSSLKNSFGTIGSCLTKNHRKTLNIFRHLSIILHWIMLWCQTKLRMIHPIKECKLLSVLSELIRSFTPVVVRKS